MDPKLINATITVETSVSKAIPRRQKLRAIYQAIMEFLRRHPYFAGLTMEQLALLLALLAIIIITYIVDFGMLSPIGEFAGRSARIGTALMMRLIPIGIPALVLFIEAWIADARHEAIERQKDTMFPDSGSVTRWTIAGVFLSAFVPLMNIGLTRTIIAHLRTAGAPESKLIGLQLSLWVLAVLSFAGHLVIAFSGDKPKKLKGLLLYGIRATWLSLVKKFREWRYETARRAARLRVIQYLFMREEFMKEHNVVIPIGPFATDVQQWIREEFTDLNNIDPNDVDGAHDGDPNKTKK